MMNLVENDVSVLTTKKLVSLCESIEEEIESKQRQAFNKLKSMEGVFALVSSRKTSTAKMEHDRKCRLLKTFIFFPKPVAHSELKISIFFNIYP